jgi:hypothetical protein
MGRIGTSCPRFEEASRSSAETAEAQDNSAFQTLGAIIGILCALSLIGWVLTR